MKSLALLWSLAGAAAQELWADKRSYVRPFLALLFLSNAEIFLPLANISEESSAAITLSILIMLLIFVVLSHIVLMEKRKHGGGGELKYFVPTFLLYNIYYSFLFLIGIFLFVLPGLYVLIYFFLVPLVAVLDDSIDGQYFKRSKELVQKNLPLVIWAATINLGINFIPMLGKMIDGAWIKYALNFLISIPESYLTLLFTITNVKIFYHLKRSAT